MNVTPKDRERQSGDLWRIECGICSHIFNAEIVLKRRMITRCPNCASHNVWNDPTAPSPDASAAT